MILVRNFQPNQTYSRFYARSSPLQSSAEYCVDLVKSYDYENFLCTLLMSNTSRSYAFAIRAFNVKIAQISQQVTQETISLMKLKFWEDTLDKCYGNDISKVPRDPVAVELFKAINQSKLTKRYFNNLIACRKKYLTASIFNTLDDLETYAEQSVSNNYYLILEGCGVRNVNADHAASHLGKAQGLTQLLRGLAHVNALNFIPIPQSILIKYDLSQEDVFRGHKRKAISDCTYELASRAHIHLEKAKQLMDNVPKQGKQALLADVPVRLYLERLQKSDYDVFDKSIVNRSWLLLPRLLFYSFKNK